MSELGKKDVTPVYRWFRSDSVFIALDRLRVGESVDTSTESAALPQAASLQLEPVSDLHDAILLAEYEPLLQCLAALMGQDEPWEPVNEPSVALHEMTHMPRITATLTSLQGVQRTIYLAIPVEELEHVSSVPEQWQSLAKIETHVSQFYPCIQSCDFSDEELDKVISGALVLLEESFNERWSIKLGVRSTSIEPNDPLNEIGEKIRISPAYDGLFDSKNQTIRLGQHRGGAASASTLNDSQTLFFFDEPVMVNHLYAESVWQAGRNFVLALSQSLDELRVGVVLPSRNERPGKTLFGSLKRVGRGYGVLIDDELG